ncbi:MAG: ABC transporter ATP-binding protein [Planctomycetota bacterium]
MSSQPTHRSNLSAFQGILRVRRLIRPDYRDLWLVVAFSVAVGVLALALPIAVQMLFNYVAFGAILQPLVVLGIVLLFVLTLAACMRTVISFVVELLQRRVFARSVADLGERLPRISKESFCSSPGPEVVNRFFDVLNVQKSGATLLLDGIAMVLQTVIGLVIVAFYHPFLLGFSAILLFSGCVVIFVLGRSAVRTAVDESTAKYKVAATLQEVAHNHLAFKLADAHGLSFARADAAAKDYILARRRHFRIVLRQIIGALFVQVVAASSLFMIGGYLVISEQLTLGQLVAAELIVTTALSSFTKIAEKLGSLYDLMAGAYKLTSLMDMPTERELGEAHAGGAEPASLDIRDVTFAYPDGRNALAGISLRIDPGERLAIIGGHASGKSTLVDLIDAAREPTNGRIELDGVDMRELRVGSIRRNIAVASEIDIIAGTVEQNVLLGRPGTTAADARAALDAVGLLEEMRALPNGLASDLSMTGAPLSTSQRARLVIARALAGRPRLLIIDDLLDMVDQNGRRKLAEWLGSGEWPCTVILLSRNNWVSSIADRTVHLSRPTPQQPATLQPVNAQPSGAQDLGERGFGETNTEDRS